MLLSSRFTRFGDIPKLSIGRGDSVLMTDKRLLNEIYAVLRLYKNFFLPTIKLASKTRVNGRIKRSYDQARTPYQRLMESRQIDRKAKQQLKAIYETLNPAELQRRLSQLREQLETVSAAKSEIVLKRLSHGPGITINKQRAERRVPKQVTA